MMRKGLLVAIAMFGMTTIADAATITVTGKWTNPDPTTSVPADGIRMERSIDNGTTWVQACQVAATATQCTDTPQPIGPTYNYRIVAFSGFGITPSPNFLISTASPTGRTGTTFTYSVQP